MKKILRPLAAALFAPAGALAAIEAVHRAKFPDESAFEADEAAILGSVLAFTSALALGINHFLRRRWA